MNLLEAPHVFDIVVSDFGREATIEFVRSVAIMERRVIRSLLGDPSQKFFDEYRRIMFVVIAELSYFKHELIKQYAGRSHLDQRVLVGIGDSEVPSPLRMHLLESVCEQVGLAHKHGYQRIRVVIPCNTLAPIGAYLQKELSGRFVGKTVSVSVHTIPAAVLSEIEQMQGNGATLLILGTASAANAYSIASAETPAASRVKILTLLNDEQSLLNETIVASIDGDASAIRQLRQRIVSEIIMSRKATYPDLIVVEACTDFDLGIGISSREVFADRLVREAYGLPVLIPLHSRLPLSAE